MAISAALRNRLLAAAGGGALTLAMILLGSPDGLEGRRYVPYRDVAGVWHRNRSEVSDRTRLYNQWRRQLCGLLGIPPGPSLGNGVSTVTRC